jgi:hypothetical protein
MLSDTLQNGVDLFEERRIVKFSEEEKEIVVKGIVAASDWDKNDNVVSVKLFTENDQDFTVETNEKGIELKKHLRELVEVKGVLKGERIISVKSYEIINRW